jgi:GT2 family glycosyltransferase
VDLSYRAWKRGWVVMYEPRSLVYHLGGGTIPKFYTLRYINMVIERNKYFLVWKNITDWKMLLKHLFFIPLRQTVNLLRLDFASFMGFFCALKQLGEILRKRKLEKQYTVMSERKIFNFFKEQ